MALPIFATAFSTGVFMTSKPGFTNVSVQKFASEGDLALFERNWSEHRELVLGKLCEKALVGFTAHQVWNQD